jgi:hypothetical protein
VLMPIARPLRAPEKRAWQTLLFLGAIYAITVLTTPKWYPTYLAGTVFLTLALVWTPAGLAYLRGAGRISRVWIGATVTAVIVLGVVLGRAQETQYATQHYTKTTLFLEDGGPQRAFAFAQKQHDKRIGIAGSGEIFFAQYGFYGADLSNLVQYIGVPGPDGQYTLATTCREFRNQINRGNYDYLIISQYTQDSITTGSGDSNQYRFPIQYWVKTDPALEEKFAEPDISPQPDYVYKVLGKMDLNGCATIKQDIKTEAAAKSKDQPAGSSKSQPSDKAKSKSKS